MSGRTLCETIDLANGNRIEIHYDETPENPRTAYDNVGKMVIFYGRDRYTLGDEQPKDDHLLWLVEFAIDLYPEAANHIHLHYRRKDEPWEEAAEMWNDELCDRVHEMGADWLIEKIRQRCVILPITVYEHSGITMRTSKDASIGVKEDGYIYIKHNRIREEWSGDDAMEKAAEYLFGEVQTYAEYLEGQVYGYKVFGPPELDEDGEEIEDSREELESCWGFYGQDYCIEEAKSVAGDDELKEAA